MVTINFGYVANLPPEEQGWLNELVEIYRYHQTSNEKKREYYDGKIALGDVNLGIAIPSTIAKLQIGCAWGAKTVDVLAAHSIFDGFVTENGTESADRPTDISQTDLS